MSEYDFKFGTAGGINTVCKDCGAVVSNIPKHDNFHELISLLLTDWNNRG